MGSISFFLHLLFTACCFDVTPNFVIIQGLASMSVPMFLAETAPAGSRGLLVTLNVSFITGGQAVAAIFSGALSTTVNGWR